MMDDRTALPEANHPVNSALTEQTPAIPGMGPKVLNYAAAGLALLGFLLLVTS